MIEFQIETHLIQKKMFANQVQINLTTLASGATATTINIPITMEYQLVDQTDIINTVFV